jgi:hypothetical protein
MAAVSCVTLPVSGSSILAAIANTITTVGMQRALAHYMGKVRKCKYHAQEHTWILFQASMPVFTLPFTLSTLFILLAWQQRGQGAGRVTGEHRQDTEGNLGTPANK